MKSGILQKMRLTRGKNRSCLVQRSLSFLALCLCSLSSLAQNYDVTTTAQCNNTAGGNEIVNFTGATPTAVGNGTVTWYFRGDLDASSEYADLYGEGSGPILGTTTSSTTGNTSPPCGSR